MENINVRRNNEKNELLARASKDKLGLIPLGEKNKFPTKSGLFGRKNGVVTYSDVKHFDHSKHVGNIGIICGQVSGILVLDCDVNTETQRLLDTYNSGKDIKTFSVRAGASGRHYYFKYDQRVQTGTDVLTSSGFKGFDIRSDNSYIVAPSSIYGGCGDVNKVHKKKNGCTALGNPTCKHFNNMYTAVEWSETINTVPEWLLTLLLKEEKKEWTQEEHVAKEKKSKTEDMRGYYDEHKEFVDDLLKHINTERWDDYKTWVKLTWACQNLGVDVILIDKYASSSKKYDVDAMNRLLDNFNPEKCKIGLSFLKKCAKTDMGDSAFRDLCVKHGERDPKFVKYIYQGEEGLSKLFLLHSEGHHKALDGNTIYEFNKKTKLYEMITTDTLEQEITDVLEKLINNELFIESKKGADDDDTNTKYRKILRKQLDHVTSCSGRRNVVKMLIPKIRDDDFFIEKDRDEKMIPLAGGKVLNLLTLEERDRTPDDWWTGELKYSFLRKPNSECKNVMKFLEEIFIKNTEIIPYFIRALGYSITACTSEKLVFYHVGTGNNGKTVLFKMIDKVMNSRTKKKKFGIAEIDSRLIDNDEKGALVGAEFVVLQNARIGTHTEPKEGMTMNAKNMKKFSGDGDTITCRYLFSNNPITFVPILKIHYVANELPKFKGTDLAMVNRTRVFHYTNSFNITDENKKYVNKLISEHSDELQNIMINEAHEYLLHGMPEVSPSIMDEIKEYVRENDPVGTFIDSYCEIEKDVSCECSKLYDFFKNQMKEQMTMTSFGTAMKKKGFVSKVKKIGKKNTRVYVGITFVADENPEDRKDNLLVN